MKLSPEQQKSFDESIRKERMPILKSGFGAPAAFAGTLKAPFQVAAAPFHQTKVTPEEQKYGFKPDAGPAGRFGQEIGRQMFVPMGESAAWWKQQLSDPKARATLIDSILGVGPQVLGQTVGTLAGGKVLSAAPEASAKAINASYNPVGVKTRGLQGINEAVAAHGEAAADPAPIRESLDTIKTLANHGHGMPDVVKKMVAYWDGMDKAKTAPGPEGAIEQPSSGLSFADLKKWREALDTKIDWDKVEGGKTAQMDRAVKGLRRAADVEEIKSVYKSGGASEASKYVKAKQNYSRAMNLEKTAGTVGGVVAGTAGVLAGAESVRATGLPYGGWIGGTAGGALGRYLGGKYAPRAMRAVTEAGMPRETMTAAEQAASELKAEKASSVKAAQEFGQPSMSNIDLDAILRRSKLPEAEQAKIRAVIEQNETMRRTRDLPKDPDAPTQEIMARGKAAYEQKYGKPKQSIGFTEAVKGARPGDAFIEQTYQRLQAGEKIPFSEKAGGLENKLQSAYDRGEIKSSADVKRITDQHFKEIGSKATSYSQAPKHNDAIAQAKKELGATADIRKILQRADEIEREGRK
jgi:hypothetical protein